MDGAEPDSKSATAILMTDMGRRAKAAAIDRTEYFASLILIISISPSLYERLRPAIVSPPKNGDGHALSRESDRQLCYVAVTLISRPKIFASPPVGGFALELAAL